MDAGDCIAAGSALVALGALFVTWLIGSRSVRAANRSATAGEQSAKAASASVDAANRSADHAGRSATAGEQSAAAANASADTARRALDHAEAPDFMVTANPPDGTRWQIDITMTIGPPSVLVGVQWEGWTTALADVDTPYGTPVGGNLGGRPQAARGKKFHISAEVLSDSVRNELRVIIECREEEAESPRTWHCVRDVQWPDDGSSFSIDHPL